MVQPTKLCPRNWRVIFAAISFADLLSGALATPVSTLSTRMRVSVNALDRKLGEILLTSHSHGPHRIVRLSNGLGYVGHVEVSSLGGFVQKLNVVVDVSNDVHGFGLTICVGDRRLFDATVNPVGD